MALSKVSQFLPTYVIKGMLLCTTQNMKYTYTEMNPANKFLFLEKNRSEHWVSGLLDVRTILAQIKEVTLYLYTQSFFQKYIQSSILC